MSSIGTGLLVLAFFIALPVIIPVAIFLSHRYKRRLRRLAQSTPCQSCGKILGLEALRLADAEWSAHVAELHEKNPGIRVRLVRLLHAICRHCGTRYTHFEEENEFRVEVRE